jgi:hypothetical protein
MPFTYFRPGESYVETGDTKFSFPTKYRKIASKLLNNETLTSGFYGNKYMPMSPIIQNPKFFLASPAVPMIKSALPTDIAPYKYFVSDDTSKSITGIYEKPITTNKIVLKFNTLMTVPTVNISINGTTITVDGSQSILPPNNSDGKSTGLLTLYWNGTAWTKTKWSTTPKFTSTGALSLSTTITKITVTQTTKTTQTTQATTETKSTKKASKTTQPSAQPETQQETQQETNFLMPPKSHMHEILSMPTHN